jgi:hypothetical protein
MRDEIRLLKLPRPVTWLFPVPQIRVFTLSKVETLLQIRCFCW